MRTESLIIPTARNQSVVTDRMTSDLLDYLLEQNRNPAELRMQGKYRVYALFTGLTSEGARKQLRALVAKGYTDVWIEVEDLMKVA